MLEKSEGESNTLTKFENQAFKAIAGGDREKAQELLHSVAYHEAKGAIMTPLLEFFQEISRRSDAELANPVARQANLNRSYYAVIVALLLRVLGDEFLGKSGHA